MGEATRRGSVTFVLAVVLVATIIGIVLTLQ